MTVIKTLLRLSVFAVLMPVQASFAGNNLSGRVKTGSPEFVWLHPLVQSIVMSGQANSILREIARIDDKTTTLKDISPAARILMTHPVVLDAEAEDFVPEFGEAGFKLLSEKAALVAAAKPQSPLGRERLAIRAVVQLGQARDLENLQESMGRLRSFDAGTYKIDRVARPMENFRVDEQFIHANYFNQPRLHDTLMHYHRSTRIIAPSGEESPLRDAIIAQAQSHNKRYQLDTHGNLLVFIEGTGPLASEPPIGIQAHLDMVTAAAKELTNDGKVHPLEVLKKTGIQLAYTDGYIHSHNFQTSIAADNRAAGVALMRTYIDGLDFPHRPLVLIFTREEEIGLIGAKNFGKALPGDPPIALPDQILSLDAEKEGTAVIASMAGTRIKAHYEDIGSAPIPADFNTIRVSVSGGRGGHSGTAIHRNTLNSAMTMARFVQMIHAIVPQSLIVDAVAGDLGKLNEIPTAFDLTLAVPSDRMGFLNERLKILWKEIVEEFASVEEFSENNLKISEYMTARGFGIPIPIASEAANLLISLGNGIVTTSDDPLYGPNGVTASSSWGAFIFQNNGAAHTARLGVMPRSSSDEQMSELVGRFTKTLRSWKTAILETVGYGTWQAKRDSALLRIFLTCARQIFPGMEPLIRASTGGLEPTFLVPKAPHPEKTEALVFGIRLSNAHTAREMFFVPSLAQAIRIADWIISSPAIPSPN